MELMQSSENPFLKKLPMVFLSKVCVFVAASDGGIFVDGFFFPLFFFCGSCIRHPNAPDCCFSGLLQIFSGSLSSLVRVTQGPGNLRLEILHMAFNGVPLCQVCFENGSGYLVFHLQTNKLWINLGGNGDCGA